MSELSMAEREALHDVIHNAPQGGLHGALCDVVEMIATAREVEAWDCGRVAGVIDAQRTHHPNGSPADRLMWIVLVAQTEPNPHTPATPPEPSPTAGDVGGEGGGQHD